MKNSSITPVFFIMMLACAVSLERVAGQAPELLFKDTFTATNSTMDLYTGSGQSGSLATPIGYTFTGAFWQTQIVGNNADLYANGNTASFSLAHNFTDAQHLRLSSTFTVPQGTAWIKFGSGPNADFNVAGGAAFVFDATSALYFWDGASGSSLGTLLQANNTLVIEMLSSADYDGTGTVAIQASLNDVPLNLGPGNTYTTAAGFTQNYVSYAHFSGGFSSWSVQDWQVDVVPEPSTYALLVLAAGGLGAHVVRRRRQR